MYIYIYTDTFIYLFNLFIALNTDNATDSTCGSGSRTVHVNLCLFWEAKAEILKVVDDYSMKAWEFPPGLPGSFSTPQIIGDKLIPTLNNGNRYTGYIWYPYYWIWESHDEVAVSKIVLKNPNQSGMVPCLTNSCLNRLKLRSIGQQTNKLICLCLLAGNHGSVWAVKPKLWLEFESEVISLININHISMKHVFSYTGW